MVSPVLMDPRRVNLSGDMRRPPVMPGQAGVLGAPVVPQPIAPPTGLIGSEQALTGGLRGATGALLTGAGIGREDIQSSIDQALKQLRATQSQVSGAIGRGRASLGQARGDVSSAIGQGVDVLNPFVAPGQQAQQVQAALSGALGRDAQAQAFQDFLESPEQAFLREQGRREVLASQAALGGLGGGNVLRELTRFGTGLAAQDFQNRFNRLGAVTGQGLQAAGQVGALRGQQAGIMGQLGQAGASLAGQQASLAGQLGQTGAQALLSGGINLANIAGQTGTNIAGLISGTGQQLAAGRTRAGEQIAGQVGATTSALSNLLQQQGAGISDIVGGGAANLGNLLTGEAQQRSASQERLAGILANLAVQQGTLAAGQPSPAQFLKNEGILKDLAALAQGIGGAMSGGAMSDKRLKVDIRKAGKINGINFYKWRWKWGGNGFGVIAQEVQKTHPDAVIEHESGYLMVKYGDILNG